MKRPAVVLSAVILPAVLLTAGCQDACKKELAALKLEYNDLQLKNNDFQKSLDEASRERQRLMTALDDSQTQLSSARTEIATLKKQGPTGTAPQPPPPPETRFTLASDIAFAAGRAALSAQGKSRLAQIAATIKKSHPGAMVRVYGYTDNDPIRKTAKLWQDNLDLSANRAMAVTRELQRLGISAENIETVAMGATHFVSPNATNAGKAKNRRVEIVVVRKP